MIKWIFIFIFNIIYSQSNPICRAKRYQCSSKKFENEICAHVNDVEEKFIYLQECPKGKFCPYIDAKYGIDAVCQEIKTKTQRLPSQNCENNGECLSNKCDNKICKGVESGGLCFKNEDCDVKLYCSQDNICKPLEKFDQSCRDNYDCENNLVCNLNKCQFYYSLQLGIQSNNAEACESGYILKDKCSKALKSKFHSQPCTNDIDCAIINDKNEVKGFGKCICGFNAGAFSYCSLTEGDIEFISMKSSLVYILARNANCHTLLRFGPCKDLIQSEYLDFNKKLTLYKKAPNVIMNDICIAKIINWDYWQYFLTKTDISKIVKFLIFIILY